MKITHMQHPEPQPAFPEYEYVITASSLYAAEVAAVGYERGYSRWGGTVSEMVIHSTPDPLDPEATRVYTVLAKHGGEAADA